MARSAKLTEKDAHGDQDQEKIQIGQHCKKVVPSIEWLQEDNVNSSTIEEWWGNRNELVIGGANFCEGMTKKPGVAAWKLKANEFVNQHEKDIPREEHWIDNPKGYANVLKGILPFFILVPAVRDVTDESKGTKSSPFGKLLSIIVQSVTDEKKNKIEAMLQELSKQMNRMGGEERVPLIAETEKQLNTLLGELFSSCDLEIEFETPTLDVLLSTPKIYINDGLRNSVENKGHGLQRGVIFSILRQYAEIMSRWNGKERNLILAVEEPELYMHPQAQRSIRSVFKQIAGGGDQVFFTTHSALLVDVAYFDEIIRVERYAVEQEGNKTVESIAYQVPIQLLIDDLVARVPQLKGKVTEESIRDHYSHVYNPRRNEGFFASRIILVEGATEEYSLPIYADAIPGFSLDLQGISVVECGGKGTMDRLYRIFNELHIPCYLLFDYDYGNQEANIIQKSKDLLAMVGEDDSEVVPLFVSDKVAYFKEKWELAIKAEISDYDELVAKARKNLGLPDEAGKPLIARFIARVICAYDPPIIPQCVSKILEKATQSAWHRTCLMDLQQKGEAEVRVTKRESIVAE